MTEEQEYMLWRKWNEAGRHPHNRPWAVRAKIPARWWLRYKLDHIIPKPKPAVKVELGLFAGNGGFATNPQGGTDFRAMRRAGYTWAALVVNPDLYAEDQWTDWRPVSRDQRPEFLPWCRCYKLQDIGRLIDICQEWGSETFVINLEAEAVTVLPPKEVASYVRISWKGPFAVITEPWVQNGAGWKHLNDAGAVCIVEAFQNANPAYTPAVCVQHAKDEGFTAVVPCFGIGVWADAPTNIPHGYYKQEWAGPHSDYPTEKMVYA